MVKTWRLPVKEIQFGITHRTAKILRDSFQKIHTLHLDQSLGQKLYPNFFKQASSFLNRAVFQKTRYLKRKRRSIRQYDPFISTCLPLCSNRIVHFKKQYKLSPFPPEHFLRLPSSFIPYLPLVRKNSKQRKYEHSVHLCIQARSRMHANHSQMLYTKILTTSCNRQLSFTLSLSHPDSPRSALKANTCVRARKVYSAIKMQVNRDG